LVKIARAYYIEACCLQGLRNQAGIVGRGVERPCLIAGIPDDQRDALFRLGRAWR
jgi:hypothetical protein